MYTCTNPLRVGAHVRVEQAEFGVHHGFHIVIHVRNDREVDRAGPAHCAPNPLAGPAEDGHRRPYGESGPGLDPRCRAAAIARPGAREGSGLGAGNGNVADIPSRRSSSAPREPSEPTEEDPFHEWGSPARPPDQSTGAGGRGATSRCGGDAAPRRQPMPPSARSSAQAGRSPQSLRFEPADRAQRRSPSHASSSGPGGLNAYHRRWTSENAGESSNSNSMEH